ncbi:MAG TPA: hypothetical protein VMW48_16005, partial [Vicinamibacterales bacterium]|nr:hypothetical protein [Vicinamibacterales bacterium]
RLAGAAADAAPVLSPTPALLTHANYGAGLHEVAVAATAGNGFAAGNEYSVFCSLTVDGENPAGLVGSFYLTAASDAPITVADIQSGLAPAGGEMDLIDAPNATAVTAIQSGLAPASEYDTELDATISSRAPAAEYDTEMAHLDADITSRAPAAEYDTEMAHLDADVSSRASKLYADDLVVLGTVTDIGYGGTGFIDTNLAQKAADYYNGGVLVILTGTAAKQRMHITDTAWTGSAMRLSLNTLGQIAASNTFAILPAYAADISALALEATLTAMKGGGWTDETLVTLQAAA